MKVKLTQGTGAGGKGSKESALLPAWGREGGLKKLVGNKNFRRPAGTGGDG